MTTAAATGAATAQRGPGAAEGQADAEPAARLGISTARTTNQDDSAWVSRASGGTTSATDEVLPGVRSHGPEDPGEGLRRGGAPGLATSSRRFPPEATSAPSTARCAIPVRALAALG